MSGLDDGTSSWVDAADYTAGLRPGARIHEGWSQEQHLLADQVDLLVRLNWLQGLATSAALGKKDRKVLNKPPKVLDRPGVEKPKPKFTDPKDLKKLLSLKHITDQMKARAEAEAARDNPKAWTQVLKNVDVPEVNSDEPRD